MGKWRTAIINAQYGHFLDNGDFYTLFIDDVVIEVDKKTLNDVKKQITECFYLRYNKGEQLIKLTDGFGNEVVLKAKIG